MKPTGANRHVAIIHPGKIFLLPVLNPFDEGGLITGNRGVVFCMNKARATISCQKTGPAIEGCHLTVPMERVHPQRADPRRANPWK